MPNHFETALDITLQHEGLGLSEHRCDPGGKTYCGISRVYWPDWDGWRLIDKGIDSPFLAEAVKEFYRKNFWIRIKGDELAAIAPEIAYEVFDSAVNMDVADAVRFLQAGFNTGRGEYGSDLLVDGKLGPKTLETINRYINSRPGSPKLSTEILLNCMNGEQYIFYKNNPRHKYFRGWFTRI